MEKQHPLSTIVNTGSMGLTATLLVGFAWSSAALSATFNDSHCRTAKSVVQLESPVDALSISRVDHVPVEADSTTIETLGAAASATDPATPFLYLTPRVASVLREIFAIAKDPTAAEKVDTSVSSPLAGSDETAEQTEFLDETSSATTLDDEINRLRLQRQMFRTDI